MELPRKIDYSTPWADQDNSDDERQRELDESFPPSIRAPSTTQTLQVFTQLLVHQLRRQYAAIALVHRRHVELFVVSSEACNLSDKEVVEPPVRLTIDQSILTDRRVGLVALTLQKARHFVQNEVESPLHEVINSGQDLTKTSAIDAKLSPLGYYCGVPLVSRNGIIIGVLCIFDSSPQSALPATGIEVFRAISRRVMDFLYSQNDLERLKRSLSFHNNTAAFSNIHGRTRPGLSQTNSYRSQVSETQETDGADCPDESKAPARSNTSLPRNESSKDREASSPGTSTRYQDDPTRSSQRGERSSDHVPSVASQSGDNLTEAAHQQIFDRATSLLHGALDLFTGGGVVMLDTNPADSSPFERISGHMTPHQEKRSRRSRSGSAYNPPRAGASSTDLTRFWSPLHEDNEETIRENAILVAATLSEDAATRTQSLGRADSSYKIHLTPSELQALCMKYPRGKLFDLPPDIKPLLHDQEGRNIASALSHKASALALLKRQFQYARQIIFVPMFPLPTGRWTCLFAYTNTSQRKLTYDLDYTATLVFCHAVKSELEKLAYASLASKGPNITPPISHEFRSPLHGLLASVELLKETQGDMFQTSCIESIDACARTLFDAVSMLLDLKSSAGKRRPSGVGYVSLERPERLSATNSIFSEPVFIPGQVMCDVAVLSEEVVDALACAHLTKYRIKALADAGNYTRSSAAYLQERPWLRRVLNVLRADVEFVFNIEGMHDWRFITQPGCIRRIIMNLLSNALKFTSHGIVSVSLHLKHAQAVLETIDNATRPGLASVLVITVKDTGMGISPWFLDNRLFKQFEQEDVNSYGNGLGLSIAKSIVTMLGGRLHVNSVLNVGTVAVVEIPMRKPARAGDSENARDSVPEYFSSDPRTAAIQSMEVKPEVTIYDASIGTAGLGKVDPTTGVLESLNTYLRDWFRIFAATVSDFDDHGQILFVDENHLPALIARHPGVLDVASRQSVIILCSCPTRQSILNKDIGSNRVGLVCKPFGPHKLARALFQVIETAAKPPTKAEYIEISGPEFFSSAQRHSSRRTRRDTVLSPDFPISPTLSLPQESSSELQSISNTACPSSICTQGERVHPINRSEFQFPALHIDSMGTVLDESTRRTDLDRRSESCSSRWARIEPLRSQSDRTVASSLSNQAEPGSPAATVGYPTSPIADAAPSTQTPLGVTRKPRLLLVDDNKLNLKILRMFILKRGFEPEICQTAADGAQAVEVFKSFHPDIVFMDLSMPVMSGLEATRCMREFEASSRRQLAEDPDLSRHLTTLPPAFIIALTGNSRDTDEGEAFLSGVDRYMLKPVDWKEVHSILREWRPKL